MLGSRLEGNLHAARFLWLQVDVSRCSSVHCDMDLAKRSLRRLAIQANANGFQFCLYLRSLFGFLGGIEYHENQITSLKLISIRKSTDST